MDDNNKQTSVISDQSSDKTSETEDQQINQSEAPIEEAKSETDKAIREMDNQAGDGEEGVPTRSRSEESSEDARRDPEPAGPATEGESSAEKPTTSDVPASTGDPSLIAQDDKKEAQDDKKTDNPARIATQSVAGGPNAKWYVVHTYSGHENKVAHTLKQRIESEHLEEKILDILVPMQNKIEIKSGKKVNIKEKIFPGYILVKMVLDDISWLAVRTTQGVTSFVGMSNKPTPISEAEVATIVKFTQSETPQYKQVFMANDTVKIVDGPFADFIGKIDSVDEEKGKVRVLVSIFGRETPVELDFLQVKKI